MGELSIFTGDYNPPPKPTLRQWLLRQTEQTPPPLTGNETNLPREVSTGFLNQSQAPALLRPDAHVSPGIPMTPLPREGQERVVFVKPSGDNLPPIA